MPSTFVPIDRPTQPVRFKILILAWFTAALAAGASGLTARLHPPLPQLVLLALTAALTIARVLWPPFRVWVHGLRWQSLVAIHLSRLVGFYFLWLYRQGQLPFEFAVPAGIGDVTVAVLAGALLVRPAVVAERPALLLGWNVLGFADIVMVVLGAARQGLTDPAAMAPLLRLPLSLLPTFLVPIIIASHLLIFARARDPRWRVA